MITNLSDISQCGWVVFPDPFSNRWGVGFSQVCHFTEQTDGYEKGKGIKGIMWWLAIGFKQCKEGKRKKDKQTRQGWKDMSEY